MHLKIPLSRRGFYFSNSEPGRRVSAFHFFVREDTTNGFLTSSSYTLVLFHHPIIESTPVSLLESKSEVEGVEELADTGEWHVHWSIVHAFMAV
jgi:hypothetical protein